MRYCVYYIATDIYKNNFATFIESLNNFYPNSEKLVIYICDDMSKIGTEEKYNDLITIRYAYVMHNPWPIVTLLKMYYIYENRVDGYDGYFYFNANSDIYEMSNELCEKFADALANDKLILSFHSFLPKQSYEYKLSVFPKELNIQAAFFGGSYKAFFSMCYWVSIRAQYDLCKRKIAQWHDETLLQEYIRIKLNTATLNDICINQFLTIDLYKDIKIPYVFICLHNTEKTNKLSKTLIPLLETGID